MLPAAAIPRLLEHAQEVAPGPQPSEKVRSKRSAIPQLSAALVLVRAGINNEHAVRALVQMALAEHHNFEYAAAGLIERLASVK